MNFLLVFCLISNIICYAQPQYFGESLVDEAQYFKDCIDGAIEGIRNYSLSSFAFPIAKGTHTLEDRFSEAEIPTELNPKNVHGQPLRFLSKLGSVLGKATDISDATTGDDTIHYNSVLVPNSVLKEEIRYLLFTNKNQDKFQVMEENGSVEGTFWNSTGKTKILIHGLTSTFWLSPLRNIWTQHIFEIKDAYFTKAEESLNIVVMDWTPLSTVPLNRYPDAAKATILAGEDLAELIFRLHHAGNLPSLEDIHLLGHSLGAHVAGVCGNRLQGIHEQYVIGRITGLDPAGLCFDTSSGKLPDNMDEILDKEDAKFVDIIHTNMGNIIQTVAGRYGSVMEAGHVDFYPNGGEVQEGCSFLENRINYCSHQKSVVFYARSILEKFVACPCDTWESLRSGKCHCDLKIGGEYFGEFCNKTARGKLYLQI